MKLLRESYCPGMNSINVLDPVMGHPPVMGHLFPTIICDKPVILDSNTNPILFKFNIPIPIKIVN